MGPVWERRFRQLVAQHRDAYRHATWDKLLEYLSIAEAKEIHSATVNGKVPEKYKPVRWPLSSYFPWAVNNKSRFLLDLICYT